MFLQQQLTEDINYSDCISVKEILDNFEKIAYWSTIIS